MLDVKVVPVWPNCAGVSVSGDEILGFYKNNLKIPDQYYRYMDKLQTVGRNLSILFRICFYLILTSAIFHVLINRNNIVMHSVKNFAISISGFTPRCNLR